MYKEAYVQIPAVMVTSLVFILPPSLSLSSSSSLQLLILEWHIQSVFNFSPSQENFLDI